MKFSSPCGKSISTNGISYHLRYKNIIIKRVSNIKFLGVILSEKIDWSPQINKVTRKISSINGILYNLRKFIPENLDLRKSIYFALVNSHLNYGISVRVVQVIKINYKNYSSHKKTVSEIYLVSQN